MKQYAVLSTKRYRKDFKHLMKSGIDRTKLENVIGLLASGKLLSERFHDHALKGALQGTRECHIGPDWLLRYAKDNDRLILLLISTGDHRRVLGVE